MDKERASARLEGKAEVAKDILKQDHSKKRRICNSTVFEEKEEAWGETIKIWGQTCFRGCDKDLVICSQSIAHSFCFENMKSLVTKPIHTSWTMRCQPPWKLLTHHSPGAPVWLLRVVQAWYLIMSARHSIVGSQHIIMSYSPCCWQCLHSLKY